MWWNPSGVRHKPILMICYTNHALDQFLEYCIKECGIKTGVVRVGGQCKSESLEQFLLKNIKFSLRNARKIDHNIHFRIRDCRSTLTGLSDLIKRYTSLIEKSYSFVLSAAQFISIAKENQIIFVGVETNEKLLKWLGLIENDVFDFVTSRDFEWEKSEEVNEAYGDENQDEDDEDYLLDEINERMIDDGEQMENLGPKINNKKSTKISDLLNEDSCDIFISKFDIFRYIKAANRNFEGWTKVEKRETQDKQLKKIESSIQKIVETNVQSAILNSEFDRNQNNLVVDVRGIRNQRERCAIYNFVLNKFREKNLQLMRPYQAKYNQAADELAELRWQEDRSIMQDALIIAMTTTGASRYHNVLRDIGPKIVIVEEVNIEEFQILKSSFDKSFY